MSSTQYPAQHTDSGPTEHEQAKARIARELQRNHRGRENAVSSKDLAERVPVAATTVRDLIPQIRREEDLPIGSGNGYYIIENREELQRQVERQQEQAQTSIQTARDMAAAYNRREL
jgi:DNA-binding transcriptional regulator YhcF (GntR family)